MIINKKSFNDLEWLKFRIFFNLQVAGPMRQMILL